jgi:probable phosphoglycerate mutase
MAIFYICRHGESENNKRKRLMGWIDTPLTEEGKQNAKSSAAKLSGIKIDRIISSDLGRAFTTAYLISREIGYNSEIVPDKYLREMNYGELANKPYEEYPRMSPEENAVFIPPGGESLNGMRSRVINRLVDIASENDDETILIVAHDGTINAVSATYGQNNMGTEDSRHNPHDYVAKFEIKEGKVISFAEVAAE